MTWSSTSELPGVLGEVAQLMVILEAGYHTRGWDTTHPTVIRVDRVLGRLSAHETPLSIFPADHPRVALQMMLLAAESPAFAQIVRVISPHPPVALLFAMESWAPGPAQLVQEGAPTDLRDRVGSVEIRQILGLVGTHTLAVVRVRDSEPEIFTGQDLDVKGEMYNLLVSIHRATMAAYRGPLPII